MKNNAVIDSFNDIDTLKNQLIERDAVIVSNEKLITEKDNKITRLEQTIAHLQLKYFGRSSERHISLDQPSLFNEAEQLEAVAIPIELNENTAEESTLIADDTSADKKIVARKPGRIQFPAAWPRVKVFHDLDAQDKNCSCGCALIEIDEVISEQLSIIPAQITVIENCRKKYRCDNCKNLAPVTSPLPAQPLPKSNASPSALA
jgi:transposase